MTRKLAGIDRHPRFAIRDWRPRPQHRPGRSGGSRNIHQAVANGVDDQFGRFVNAERVHNIGAMDRHGVGAEGEAVGDGFIGIAFDDQLQDFEFARSQAGIAFAFQGRRA